MSNVKRIRIQGDLDTLALMVAPDAVPVLGRDFAADEMVRGHNISENNLEEVVRAAKVVNRFLAMSTFPHFGLKVRFGGGKRTEKNGYNGQITYYGYEVTGEEAVSFEYFDSLVAALGMFGKVDLRACVDIEA